MTGLSREQAAQHVISSVSVTREDIARAKDWIVQSPKHETPGMVDAWLLQQGISDYREVNTDAEDCPEMLLNIARGYSLRFAFYQAAWELISAGILIPPDTVDIWEPALQNSTSHTSGQIPLSALNCPYPVKLYRLPYASDPPTDLDIFLKGIDRNSLHAGINEAMEQSLACFRRGLYMPATVMLAAAAEATWRECGAAVANKQGDSKLAATLADSYSGFAKIVADTRGVLEDKKAKPLLLKVGLTIHQVNDVEIWTTALRDRRNALHWGKAKSFIADQAETGTLLMAAPQHLGTLEMIRTAC